ncbi:Uroporphyrinogen decarboxylase [Methanosarcinaceae archaeon Ag5]|uniref:Uroporphyrinogen decarboxylase n=1 Tax=Methanolapillus africanus TaxID=3028297 RepID=A0AAE4SDM0_9EURY|nr:Uroporphyrinogen decarboxylase [Methanosarcinaceae archaeon Ag5]
MESELSAAQRFISAMTGDYVDYIPPGGGLISITADMIAAAGASWPKANQDAQMMAKLAAMPLELAGIEGATLPFDISLEAEALGATLDWAKPDRPPVKNHFVTDPDDLVLPENIEACGRIQVVLDAIEILKEKYADDLAIVPTTVAPFTIAGHLAGVENLFMWILESPEKVRALVDKITTFVIGYQELLAEYGADVMFQVDPTSSGDMLSGDMFKEFVLPSHEALAKSSPVPRVTHICGNTKPMLQHIRNSGVDGFSFDTAVPVWYAKSILGDCVRTYGNLDVIELIPRKTPAEIYAATQECIRQGVNAVGTACDIPEATPLENVKAIVQACKETPVPTKKEVREYNAQFKK